MFDNLPPFLLHWAITALSLWVASHLFKVLRFGSTAALVIAALIIGSSIVMTVQGGPTLFGLPAFGFLGFFGAVVCGLWLVRAIWRSSHHRDDD